MNYDAADEENRFPWTQEPSEPGLYSDWTIEVFTSSTVDDSVDESCPSPARLRYAVHRQQLDLKSLYFRQVFADSNSAFCEGTNRESVIELPHLAVEAFEDMLDYLYSSERTLAITTSNAVGLFFLSDYLQIQTLGERVKLFIKEDLCMMTCASYFQQANELHIQYILEDVALFCCDNPLSLSNESDLSDVADYDLWRAVLMKSQHGPTTQEAHNWSLSLAHFFELHLGDERLPMGEEAAVVTQAFQELTNPELLPSISGNVALSFLSFEKKLQLNCVDGPNGCSTTSLQERCMISLNGSWKEQCMESLREKLCTFSPVVLSSLLISAVDKQMMLQAEEVARSIESAEESSMVPILTGMLGGRVAKIRSLVTKGQAFETACQVALVAIHEVLGEGDDLYFSYRGQHHRQVLNGVRDKLISVFAAPAQYRTNFPDDPERETTHFSPYG